MNKKQIMKLGLVILVAGIMVLGYGGLCRKKKDHPAVITGSSATEVKQGTTDANGDTFFTDNSTSEQVKVTVVDDDTSNPLQGMEVTYFDGNDYEGYYVKDPNEEYLPWLEVYEHNSDHVIKMSKGEYRVEKVNNPIRFGAYWRLLTDPTLKQEVYYDTTISNVIYLALQGTQIFAKEVIGNLVLITIDALTLGATVPIHIIVSTASMHLTVKGIFDLVDVQLNNPPQNWDRYDKRWLIGGVVPMRKTLWLPSQPPFITDLSISTSGGTLSASWTGDDLKYDPNDNRYEYEEGFPDGMPDLTVFQGSTDNPDLKYSYRIVETPGESEWLTWTSWVLGQTSASVSSIPNGDYRFEVKVKDEVENVSNIASWLFSINVITSVTFSYTGGQQQWVVPVGVTSIQVDARGSKGDYISSGARGARVQTTLSVTPGETLYIYVGNYAGYNGGGGGWNNGGGASDIRQGGTTLANRIVVAGGGGGQGTIDGGYGGAGGYNGSPGTGGGAGGGGGTQSAGGAGGEGSNTGGVGSFGQGGGGYFGGGGGGYYGGGGDGGGGGWPSGGGGGGSSYSAGTNTTYTDGYQSGNGQIIITW